MSFGVSECLRAPAGSESLRVTAMPESEKRSVCTCDPLRSALEMSRAFGARWRYRCKRSRTWVYFVRELSAEGFIKIGLATCPKQRIIALRVGNPRRLELVGFVPGGYDVERAFHLAFADSSACGEWFKPTPGLTEFLASIAEVSQ